MAKNGRDEETKKMAQKWAEIIAKAWTDAAFKQRFIKNPAATLKEFGIAAPANLKIEVHEDSNKIVHLVLPQKPSAEMSEAELKKVAAGSMNEPVWRKTDPLSGAEIRWWLS